MVILDDMGVSKLSAKVFSKVNYSFKSKYNTCGNRVKEMERNSLAGKLIYTMYVVTVTAIHTVCLLCVVAFSGVARTGR